MNARVLPAIPRSASARSVQLRVRSRDRVGFARDCILDAVQQALRRDVQQRAKQHLLTGEVEVDAALRRLRLRGDLVDARLAVAATAEHGQRRIENATLPVPRPLLTHRLLHAASKPDRLVGRFHCTHPGLVPPVRLERTTGRLEGGCSIQLSYGDAPEG